MKASVTEPTRTAAQHAFIALAPPDHAKNELAHALSPAYAAHPGLRWNRIEDWHITLAFLGELPIQAVQRLRSPLADLAAARPLSNWHSSVADTSTSECCGAASRAISTNCTSWPKQYRCGSGTAASPPSNARCVPTSRWPAPAATTARP